VIGPRVPPLGVLDATRLGVARLMIDAIHAAEPVARRRNVELRCAWDSRVGIVLVDEPRMHRLLSMLLVRALERVAPRGMVLLTAELFGDEVRFCIADSAEGGEPAAADGLGAPPWAALVDVLATYGGRLWVEDEAGAETTYFTLLASPRARA
jgi:hypothetical protein